MKRFMLPAVVTALIVGVVDLGIILSNANAETPNIYADSVVLEEVEPNTPQEEG